MEGVVECLKIITAKKSLRIAKFAFDYATKNNRKKVTCVHKANIMKLGDGLFLRSCEEVPHIFCTVFQNHTSIFDANYIFILTTDLETLPAYSFREDDC